jgi:hypothetical protein
MGKRYIFETVIYDGGMKEWRILNLNTGSFYSMHFSTFDKAKESVAVGEMRSGLEVKFIEVHDIARILGSAQNIYELSREYKKKQ